MWCELGAADDTVGSFGRHFIDGVD